MASVAVMFTAGCVNKQKPDYKELTAEEATSAKYKPTKESFPVISFEKQEVDLGKIDEGDTLVHRFKFKNTGNMPLVISFASASCGCTVPRWPKYPIVPGDTASIGVVFNSKNREGQQHKTVNIIANTIPESNVVAFSVEVTKK